MRYLSLFSGIEAASAAWKPIDWKCAAVSEIEPFPCAVLAHHYPETPNLGDITKFKEWPDLGSIDLVVGGSPCQSFSIAGLRKGMDDPRGNLMLTYLAVVNRHAPRWVVYENVPGLLSSNGGRDFGTLLEGLAELGYGFAYRVLDAQYVRVESHSRAVPQRRRRVFVVGYLGDWRRAAAVLFERESLLGHPAPRRETGKGIAAGIARSVALRGREGGGIAELGGEVGLTLRASGGGGDKAHVLVPEIARALTTSNQRIDAETETLLVAHSLTGEGFDASEDGTGRGTPLVPIAFDCKASGQNGFGVGEIASTMRSMSHSNSHQNGGGHLAVAFDLQQITSKANRSRVAPGLPAPTMAKQSDIHVATEYAVRRLMPMECERLQGFPDSYTNIEFRRKQAADGNRYKALGNSMAVNVMRHIGNRIQLIDNLSMEIAA
ncbi:DNA cytosine methyltransferase [Paraburkholderia sediminicola]|uniref:DNA cytosine methyltransferase n=1 Tax=Paraburkholderia sediminicola TaxID=458836 RepID=UPI0038B7B019